MSLSRWSVFALSMAGLAACGDDGGSNPPIDAPVSIDGRVIDAANPDAADLDAPAPDAAVPDAAVPDAAVPDAASPDAAVPPDAASPDAPPAPMNTTVWVFGDVATDNDNQIGRFPHPQSAVVTPTFVPATGFLTDGGGFPVSISPDNTTIAYASSAAGTSPLTLSVSGTDGTGAVNVFTTTSPAVITHVAISPDKTKIAFRADLALAGQFDIYIVPALASQTPVRVSTDRNNANLDALEHMTWSADSRYLAFGGEMLTDGYNEVLVRDTATNATTVVVSTAAILATAAPRGMLLPAQWGPGGKLYVAAVVSALNERKLFWANADGTALQILPNSELTRTDSTISQSNTFSLSPDGTRIAFSSDGVVATAFELYVMPSNGSAVPTRLSPGTAVAGRSPDAFRTLEWNPAGTEIAFGADYSTVDNKFEPYVATVSPVGLRRLAAIGDPTNADQDATRFAWTHDGAFIYVAADPRVNNDAELFVLNAAMTDQTPTLLVDPPTAGDVFEIVTRFAP